MLLVTGDRDMYQLVTEHVNVVSTRKGLSDVAIMTPESVDDLYHGITPALVPDFYGLKGDTSDNIPGVPGIGPKKASALIAQYGSLDEVIAHADEVKGKMGENLRAHIDDALLSRKVATIRTDAPVELDFDETSFPAFSADEVSAALGALGITAMQNRFLSLIGGEGGAAATVSTFEIPAVSRAAAGDAEALTVAAAEISRVIEAGEWIAAVVDDDKEEGALFGLTRTLWLATSKGLFALEEGDSCAAAEVEGFNFAHGVIAGVLARLFMEAAWRARIRRRCCMSFRPSILPSPSSWIRWQSTPRASSIPWLPPTCWIPTAPSLTRRIWPIPICRWRCLRRAVQRMPARTLLRPPLARRP